MLLSQSLIHNHSFTLDNYSIPHYPPLAQDYANKNGLIYQLEWVDGHLYYFFPPGTSILSMPFVVVMNEFGVSAVNADGTYDLYGEILIEGIIAALLMATTTVLFFLTSRLVLPVSMSLIVAFGGALGTQVWSTASRALWSDSWGVLLFAIVIYLLLAAESKRRDIQPELLATLLSWAYFVRPTANLPILAITVYIAIWHRRQLLRYIVTGAVWLVLFIGYSFHLYGKPLPNYYLARRLSFGLFFQALGGHLISPSRGLLIYVPMLLFVAGLLIRYHRFIVERRLLWLSLFVIVAHMVVISGFDHWWGGFCYGPRLTTSLVPWFVLLAIVALHAWAKAKEQGSAAGTKIVWSLQSAIGIVFLAASIFINARGAIARDTWIWNTLPANVDVQPDRLWNWRDPQMLAGLFRSPLPKEFPLLNDRVELSSPESAKYLWYGWSGPEPELRWTDGNEAAFVFKLNDSADKTLWIKLAAYVVAGKHPQQRLTIRINGTEIQTLELKDKEPKIYSFALPTHLLQPKNILTFDLPDAIAPATVEQSYDLRRLGLAVWWIGLEEKKIGS